MVAKLNKPNVLTVTSLGKESNGYTILDNVSFSVQGGDMVGIIGPNGAGKSTLANIILGFDAEHTGTVTVGEGVRMSYVPQHSKLDIYALPMSVAEFMRTAANSYYGTAEQSDNDHLLQMLTHVGLTEKHLKQNIHSLSGGQFQRVLIARALISEPTFLLLDEPLAAVDYAARDSLYLLLRHLNQEHNITMLVISHDVESIMAISDSVLCLNHTLHYGCHPTDFAKGAITEAVLTHHNHVS